MIRCVGVALTSAYPVELSIGNMVRRVLFVIRHETASLISELERGVDTAKAAQQQTGVDLSLSLHRILDQQSHTDIALGTLDAATISSKLKPQIIEEIGLLIDEIRNAEGQIAECAIEHIFAKEVILTCGLSHTVQAFLKEAAKFRKFEVIVAESAPSFTGHVMARNLSDIGIEVTVITDAAVFAMMPSVNKVLIGTHVVMANGGLIAHTGAANIAAAAKYHSVPVVVLTGLHKLW